MNTTITIEIGLKADDETAAEVIAQTIREVGLKGLTDNSSTKITGSQITVKYTTTKVIN
tara:strand:+ start:466 stop:642 length:177 start_codon:yes stop_codon:yes gene_type:complete